MLIGVRLESAGVGLCSLTGAKWLVNSSLKKAQCPVYLQHYFLLDGCTTPLYPTHRLFLTVLAANRDSLYLQLLCLFSVP